MIGLPPPVVAQTWARGRRAKDADVCTPPPWDLYWPNTKETKLRCWNLIADYEEEPMGLPDQISAMGNIFHFGHEDEIEAKRMRTLLGDGSS